MEGKGEERVVASRDTNVSCIPLRRRATKFLDIVAAAAAWGASFTVTHKHGRYEENNEDNHLKVHRCPL